jgi:hypothetical protein
MLGVKVSVLGRQPPPGDHLAVPWQQLDGCSPRQGVRLITHANVAAQAVLGATLWAQLSAAAALACHQQSPQIQAGAAQPRLSQVRAQHISAARLQQQSGERLLLDGVHLSTRISSDAAQSPLLLL